MTFSPVELTVTDMKAAFPVQSLVPIPSRSNLFELHMFLNKSTDVARLQNHLCVSFRYLFVTLTIEYYQKFTTVSFIRPAPTQNIINFESQRKGQQKQIRLNWNAHKAENNNIDNMNEALTTIFYRPSL